MAVSDSCQTVKLYVESNSPENTLSNSHSRLPSALALDVTSTTIDDFCGRHQISPTLIKIDIEGFELHALRGGRETLARFRPKIVLELHPMNSARSGSIPAN